SALDGLDLEVHARRKTDALVEGVNGLVIGLVDVDQALVRADFKLLARLPVNVRAAQDGVALDASRQRDGAVDVRPGLPGRLDDLLRGTIQHLVVVGLHPDLDTSDVDASHSFYPFMRVDAFVCVLREYKVSEPRQPCQGAGPLKVPSADQITIGIALAVDEGANYFRPRVGSPHSPVAAFARTWGSVPGPRSGERGYQNPESS